MAVPTRRGFDPVFIYGRKGRINGAAAGIEDGGTMHITQAPTLVALNGQ
jgi:hypothetical protein